MADSDGKAASPSQVTLCYPKAAWIGGLAALAFIAPVAAGAIIGAVFLIVAGYALPFIMILALLGAFMTGLCLYVGRDAFAKMRWRIDIGPQTVNLRLPANRSISHKLHSVSQGFARTEIDAIEHRLEGYSSFGLANLQRCYAIRLVDGQRIILGEARALDTALAQTFVADAADRLAQELAIGVEEKPIVGGNGGILGVWFVRPPDWDVAPLDEAAANRLLRRVALTGQLAVYGPLAALLLAAAAAFF